MISIEELNQVKNKRKTNLYYEEKEYLQYIFLNAISKYPDNFVFNGGTCLRICFEHDRASEDLDFNTNLSINKLKVIVTNCLKEFGLLNINYNIYSEKVFEGNIRIEIRFEGPLFAGKLSSTNILKIDFNKKKVKHRIVKVIQKLFSDVPQFTIVVLDEKEIFAEKIRALINRGEPRDLYDIWVLLNKKTDINKKLVLSKLEEEKVKITKLKIPSKEEYELSLKNLVNILPNYEQVNKEVSELLKRLFNI